MDPKMQALGFVIYLLVPIVMLAIKIGISFSLWGVVIAIRKLITAYEWKLREQAEAQRIVNVREGRML